MACLSKMNMKVNVVCRNALNKTIIQQEKCQGREEKVRTSLGEVIMLIK